ncbi:MAG: hypothetical protein AVO39_10230 [delta proteobacterium MLS_D]|nr:MAG: hypothetical protein AVO39_10230 [delta proteobacterium MLS_D]
MTYVRIKPPQNKGQDVPQSISTGGVKIVRGGPGIEVPKNIIGALKKIGGGHIETSEKPFEVVKKTGGVIDLEAGKMRYPDEEDATENTEKTGKTDKAGK